MRTCVRLAAALFGVLSVAGALALAWRTPPAVAREPAGVFDYYLLSL